MRNTCFMLSILAVLLATGMSAPTGAAPPAYGPSSVWQPQEGTVASLLQQSTPKTGTDACQLLARDDSYNGRTFGTCACSSAIRLPGDGCVLRNSGAPPCSAFIIFCQTLTADRGS